MPVEKKPVKLSVDDLVPEAKVEEEVVEPVKVKKSVPVVVVEEKLLMKKGNFSLLQAGEVFVVRDEWERKVAVVADEQEGRALVLGFNRR